MDASQRGKIMTKFADLVLRDIEYLSVIIYLFIQCTYFSICFAFSSTKILENIATISITIFIIIIAFHISIINIFFNLAASGVTRGWTGVEMSPPVFPEVDFLISIRGGWFSLTWNIWLCSFGGLHCTSLFRCLLLQKCTPLQKMMLEKAAFPTF